MAHRDPWDAPGWQALHREASLVQQLIGSGVTSLGKANYADNKGEYYNAFFGLSVGIERLAKLVLVVDYAIGNGGKLPDQSQIKRYGHQLLKLLDGVDAASTKHKLQLEYLRPADDISRAAIICLDEFADAARGRYANFQALGDPNFESEFEPISKWWEDVAKPILDQHYKGTAKENAVVSNAERAHALLSGVSSVRFFNEAGELMQDVRTASIRSGQTEVVQKFGRYYVLKTVRWLAHAHAAISDTASRDKKLDAFAGHSELFNSYRVDDSFLKTRKVWPL